MKGQQLSSMNELFALYTRESDTVNKSLSNWCSSHGISFHKFHASENPPDEMKENSRQSLGVTVGGDGAFLEGVNVFTPRNIPLVGINRGNLAFLARVQPEDIEGALTEVFRGRATVNERQKLEINVPDSFDNATGINDVMIEPERPENAFDRKICSLHVFVNDEYIGNYVGSGVAVSTPTGSTGVALSANGPVHHPSNNETLQIVPLHTHNIGVRPVIVDASADIRIVPDESVNVQLDGGRQHSVVGSKQTIHVTGADDKAQIVRTSYDDKFFGAVEQKLGWDLPIDQPPKKITGTSDETSRDFYQKALETATTAADGAADVLRELHGNVENVEFKTDASDIVTEADYQAEQIITTIIENTFPHHSIYSEEDVRRNTDSQYTWIIDPLDGSGNFANGNPNYATSIGLLEGKDPIIGVVNAPESREKFTAIQGRGAWENGNRISVTERDSLNESVLLSGYDPEGMFLQELYHSTRGVRRIGSAALNLCYIAAGSADAVWEYDTYSWDVIAGLVIARESGATITDSNGNDYVVSMSSDTNNSRKSLLASNGLIHDELLKCLQESEQEF